MDTTPVMKRGRSKLSRTRTSPGAASTPVTPAGSERRPADPFSTPHRPPPPSDAWNWESPASPFSPPALSQACEIYWDDEVPGRAAELLKASSGGPGDRVPPLPAQLAASPAPLVPAAHQRTRRATRHSHVQVMALLESALLNQQSCTQPGGQTEQHGESHPRPAPSGADADGGDTPGRRELPSPTRERVSAAVGDFMESDPDLDRSLLRFSQMVEPAERRELQPAPRHSFNAFVMDAMPDEEDEIFSQIPDEALDGEELHLRAGAKEEPVVQDSSSGVSCGSSSSVSVSRSGVKRRSDVVTNTVAAGVKRMANVVNAAAQSADPQPFPRVTNSGPRNGISAEPGQTPSTSAAKQCSVNSKSSTYARPASVSERSAPRPHNRSAKPACSAVQASQAAEDPLRKAENNRRRAEALRRLRQNQRARASQVAGAQRQPVGR